MATISLTPDVPATAAAAPVGTAVAPAPTDPVLAVTVPICFQLGWSMATLYTDGPAATFGRDQLRSEHELDAADRVALEIIRLGALIDKLNGPNAPYEKVFTPDLTGVTNAVNTPKMKQALSDFNLVLLEHLTKCGVEVELAYQLGRSLRDSVNPPGAQAAGGTSPAVTSSALERVTYSLRRSRVARIQEWLVILAQHFPTNTARIVSSSIGRWSDLTEVALLDNAPGGLRAFGQKKTELADEMATLLLTQGDVWRCLLIGTQTTDDLLGPEGLFAAGDAAVRRTSRLILNVLRHYAWAILFLLAVIGVIVAVAVASLGGLGKVLTVIGTAASGLGLTWKGVGVALPKAAASAEAPIFNSEKVEAMAGTVTNLPTVKVNSRGVNYLRRSGVAAQRPLGIL